jgi:hypothetical protein
MNSSDRVNWAHRQTDRDLIRFALHRDNINLEGHECYAVMMVLACRLGDALDRSDFEASALDFDPDDARPIVAEAVQCEDVGDWSNRVKTECTVAMMWPGSCGLGTFGCTNPEHYAATASQPRQSTFAETYSRIDRQLSRARRLHQPATQEDTALAELERNFQTP